MVFWRKMSAEERGRFSLQEIVQICHISKSSVAQICHLSMMQTSLRTNSSSRKVGRLKKITERDSRAL